MLGSNLVIIERMKYGVFSNFAIHLMELGGFKKIKRLPHTEKYDYRYTAKLKSKKYFVVLEKSRGLLDVPFVQSVALSRSSHGAEFAEIITPQEFTTEAIAYARRNNIILFGRLEIEKWLSERFRSCEMFINYLDDYNIKKQGLYNAKELTNLYLKFKAEFKKTPHEHEMRKYSEVRSPRYSYKWGTWTNFLVSIGEDANVINFKPNRRQTASTVELIENYIETRNKLKHAPSMVEIDSNSKYPHDFYLKYFGTWSNFVMVIESEIEKYSHLTEKDLTDEFLRVKKKLNKPPTYSDIRLHSSISPVVFINKFQTWNNFLTSINENKQLNSINDKEIIKAYLEMEKMLGKKPAYTDIKKYYKFTHNTLEMKFGLWTNFTRLMQDSEYATLEIKEIDIFNDYFRIRNILKKTDISISEIEKFTEFKVQDYLKNFESWDMFFSTIERIDKESQDISEETLIYHYLDLLAKLSMPSLTLYDMMKHSQYYYPIYLCKFKSWAEFVVIMRDYVRFNIHKVGVLNSVLIEDYYRVEKELNKSPLKYSDMRIHGKYSADSYKKRFGSWIKFLASLGLKSPYEITKEDIISEYERIKKELGKSFITGLEYIKYANNSMDSVNKHYGGWIKFLDAMNENPHYFKRANRQELIEEFLRVKKKIKKHKIFARDIDKYGKYSSRFYKSHFGTWNDFLIKMNEDTRRYRFTEQDLIDEYFKIKKKLKKDVVTAKEFSKRSKISIGPYFMRFGSWNKFLKSLGEKTSRYIDWENITNEKLVENYRNVGKQLNKPYPSVADIEKNGKYKRSVYEKTFGKWSKFLNYYNEIEKKERRR